VKTPNSRPVEILMVEDNVRDVRLAEEALKESKIHSILHHVEDGVEAMRFLHRKGGYAHAPHPDLILLDLNLPRKDGREVLAELKEDPKLRHIPIVVMTSSEAERDLIMTYGLHANAYVVKPVDLDRFVEVVQKVNDFWLTIVRLPPKAED
jgi:two-component system, chemotaxis family, response regulator Rcp1